MATIATAIPNRRAEIPRVARVVDDLAAAQGLPGDVVADMQVALDEVLTNIISYGYADEGVHVIQVRVTADERSLTAEIEDDGRPFNPLDAPEPDLRGGVRDRAVGGLGIRFVRTLMDHVEYSRAADRNHLVLTRRTAR